MEKGDDLFCLCTEGTERLMGTSHWETHFQFHYNRVVQKLEV